MYIIYLLHSLMACGCHNKDTQTHVHVHMLSKRQSGSSTKQATCARKRKKKLSELTHTQIVLPGSSSSGSLAALVAPQFIQKK